MPTHLSQILILLFSLLVLLPSPTLTYLPISVQAIRNAPPRYIIPTFSLSSSASSPDSLPDSHHPNTFASKLSTLTRYAPYDLLGLSSPSTSQLFAGARSASSCPEVVRAFTVLYEDVPPLRISGNMIFSYLSRLAEKSKAKVDLERKELELRVGRSISRSEFVASKRMFSDIDLNNDHTLCAAELESRGSGILDAFGSTDDVEDFLKAYGTVGRAKLPSLEFDGFMVALMEAIEKVRGHMSQRDRARARVSNVTA